jgi:hypothetical protein
VVETGIQVPGGDPPVVRRRPYADGKVAQREFDAAAAELLSDGFTETTPPPSMTRPLEALCALWREEAPAFELEVLTAPLRAAPDAAVLLEAIEGLDVVWIDRPDGTKVSDNELGAVRQEAAREVLLAETPAVDAVLMLALRHRGVLSRPLHTLLSERRPPPQGLQAMLSVIGNVPQPNDRPGMVASVMREWQARGALAYDAPGLVAKLLELVASPRWETASAAAVGLVPFVADPRAFEAIWATREREGDVFEYAVLEACERRRAPETLPWLEKLSRKRRGFGWRERVEQAMAVVRGTR